MDFDSVWSRVTGSSSRDLREALESFIENEVSDAAYYSALAARSRSVCAKKLFSALAGDESCHARKLQLAYFLLTGDNFTPAARCPSLPPALTDALRLRYREEISGAEEYEAYAPNTDDETKKMLRELASDERCHASEIRKLLESCV